jgi:hypothetical protein
MQALQYEHRVKHRSTGHLAYSIGGNCAQSGFDWLKIITLKKETTKPASANFLQQQASFDLETRVLEPLENPFQRVSDP